MKVCDVEVNVGDIIDMTVYVPSGWIPTKTTRVTVEQCLEGEDVLVVSTDTCSNISQPVTGISRISMVPRKGKMNSEDMFVPNSCYTWDEKYRGLVQHIEKYHFMKDQNIKNWVSSNIRNAVNGKINPVSYAMLTGIFGAGWEKHSMSELNMILLENYLKALPEEKGNPTIYSLHKYGHLSDSQYKALANEGIYFLRDFLKSDKESSDLEKQRMICFALSLDVGYACLFCKIEGLNSLEQAYLTRDMSVLISAMHFKENFKKYNLLSYLSSIAAKFVYEMYMLGDVHLYTYVGYRMGITVERVKQCEDRVLKVLRDDSIRRYFMYVLHQGSYKLFHEVDR